MPTYSHKFKKVPRTLPDLAARPFAKEFFPPELHAALDGEDESGGQAAKRRRVGPKTLGLSSITSYKTAEELFLGADGQAHQLQQGGQVGGGGSLDKALQIMSTVEKGGEDGEGEAFLSGEDDDDWVKGNGEEDEDGNGEEDDVYEDESGDDYNAEAYFDGNQDDEDYDEGGDDGGDYF